MSRLLRALVTGFVTVLALLSPLTAHAADLDAARRGAAWLTTQSEATDDVGTLVDILLAYAAADDPATNADASAVRDRIGAGAADYVAGGPEAAAKVAIMAEALGEDPRAVGGQDLVATVSDAVGEDGAFGAFPGPFATGLGAVALHRAGEQVPDAMISHLLTYANEDGGFGFAPGGPSDADSTALALLALLTVDSPDATAARDGAIAWASENQAEDGSWQGYVPVNSTAVMASALTSAGEDPGEAVAWLAAAQDESGAFPSGGEGASGVMAATQAVLGLAGVSYLDVQGSVLDASAAPTPASGDTTGEAQASDGAESDGSIPVLPLAVVGALGVGAGAWLLLRRRRG